MKFLLSKLAFLPIVVTGCTNVTVQAPQQTAPTVTAAKTPSEPSIPVTTPVAIEASAPSRIVTTQSGSSCSQYTGKAIEGQSVNVDLCSVSPKSSGAIAFVYSLGSRRINSEANCNDGTWTTFHDGETHKPQSSATEKMLNLVCSNRVSTRSSTSQAGAAIVFDPPSNVRMSPNGAILCSVKRKTTINIYGSNGSWYNTDVCGTMGVISGDQIRF